MLNCMSSLCILNVNPLLIISFANMFSNSVGCLFVLSVVSFAVQKPLSLIKSCVFSFAFVSFALRQRSPTFLTPGTCFVEDNFSTERERGRGMVQAVMRVMIQAVMLVMAGMVQVVMWAMGSSRWSFTCLPASHLLPCGPVPKRPWSAAQGLGTPALGDRSKKYCYNLCQRVFCLCFLLRVLWFWSFMYVFNTSYLFINVYLVNICSSLPVSLQFAYIS